MRIKPVGWLALSVAFVLAIRFLFPSVDEVLGKPSSGTVTMLVVVSAFIFGYFGIEKKR